MNEPLEYVWSLAELDDPLVSQTNVDRWPQGVFQQLRDAGLLRQGPAANKVLCPECHDHFEEVLCCEGPGGRPELFVYCPEVLRAEVPPRQLRRWRLDVERLATLLAGALQPSTLPEELLRGAAWLVGRIPLYGTNYHAVFVGQTDHASLAEQLPRLVPAARTILLVGRRSATSKLGHGPFAGLVALEGICRLAQGALRLDLERLRDGLHPETGSAENVFRREGRMWTLRFGGKTIHMPAAVGLEYIAQLLSRPGRQIPAAELLAARSGLELEATRGNSGELLDAEALDQYRRRYEQLEEELAEAERNCDVGHLERLRHQRQQLARQLAAATGLGGRSRRQSDSEKIRKAVSTAVTRQIARIEKQHPLLGRHLGSAISCGQLLRYLPPEPIEWLT